MLCLVKAMRLDQALWDWVSARPHSLTYCPFLLVLHAWQHQTAHASNPPKVSCFLPLYCPPSRMPFLHLVLPRNFCLAFFFFPSSKPSLTFTPFQPTKSWTTSWYTAIVMSTHSLLCIICLQVSVPPLSLKAPQEKGLCPNQLFPQHQPQCLAYNPGPDQVLPFSWTLPSFLTFPPLNPTIFFPVSFLP